MAEDGYKHDLISFGSMIKGLQKARRTAQIPSYFKQMQKEGMRLDTMFVKTLFNNRNEEVQTALAQLKANRMFIPDSLVERINSM
jgi:pentatricopeptide repeat protein